MAAQLGSTPQAVGRWPARFVRYRIAGPGDMPRPGGPRTVTDEQVDTVVTRTLEATPKNATYWSTRSMAKERGLSQSSVSRIWRAFGSPAKGQTAKPPPGASASLPSAQPPRPCPGSPSTHNCCADTAPWRISPLPADRRLRRWSPLRWAGGSPGGAGPADGTARPQS
nr:hypothetical protein OG513_34695 [Streptomyces sp. NBC_00998]